MGTILVEGILATSEDLEAYGGINIPRSELVRLAEQLSQRSTPMTLDHDAAKPLSVRIVSAEVRNMENGHAALHIVYEVDEDEYAKVAGRQALSISILANSIEAPANSNKPGIFIAADAGHFSDEIFGAVIETLGEHFAVSSSRLYQFSFIGPPTIIVELAKTVIMDTPAALLASFLVDPLMRLVRGSEDQSVFRFQVKYGNRRVKGVLRTKNEETVRAAIETLERIANSLPGEDVHEFKEHDETWKLIE